MCFLYASDLLQNYFIFTSDLLQNYFRITSELLQIYFIITADVLYYSPSCNPESNYCGNTVEQEALMFNNLKYVEVALTETSTCQ
jgi:hypothetical protein